MLSEAELKSKLAQCYGTGSYARWAFGLVLTDGCQILARDAGACWLFDAIGSYQPQCRRDDKLREIQFWTLDVQGSKAVLTCDRDEGDTAFRQEIEYTDFPIQGKTKVWVELGSIDGENPAYVAMLPSER